jgi:F-type H+-transporting ATPase subunit delta
MRQTKVAQRYAKALFDLSVETGKVEEVKKDLDLIIGIQHKELELLLMSPVVGGDKKIAIFDAVFAKHVQPLTVSFFKLIFDKGRSVAIKDIIEAFIAKYRDMKGIKVAEITTAMELSAEAKASIEQQLQGSAILKNKKIELKEKVDPSIIGGLVVQVDDQLFDASIKHDLQFIKRQFIKNMYISEIIS